jgi:prevent-host-death family protein
MVKTIPHRELRNNSSAILREVQSGETFQITNNGKVVAVLGPPPPAITTEVRMRQATIRGGFDQLPKVKLEHPIQETLDDLRGER